MKKVSIIVPVYNVEKYIAKCLDSLVNQTLEDIEIIVVNDNSPDNSEKIILEYKEKYPNKIIYLKKENGGLSDTRNYGLKVASGEYVGFVDSDDYVSLDMFKNMYEYAKVNHLDIIACATELVYPDNSNKKKIIPASYDIADKEKNYLIAPPMACNKIYKRELFQDDFLFKTNIWYEDLELIPTLILKTKKIGFLNNPYYKYLQRNGSIMNQEVYNPKILDIIDVLNSIKNRFRKYKSLKIYQEEIEYLYIEHLLYSTPLRIACFKVEGKKYLKDIKKLIKQKFPNWKNNQYFKRKSYKFKLICFLSFYNQRTLINFLSKRR